MILEHWIAGGIVTALILGIVLYATRPEPRRNGYQARQRTFIKGAGITIIEPKNDPRIIGDGPWQVTQAEYPNGDIPGALRKPRIARIRDMQEPRGY